MRIAPVANVIFALACAACGVEKGAAVLAPGAGSEGGSASGDGPGKAILAAATRIAVAGDEIYALSGGVIYHADAALATATKVKTGAGDAVILDFAAGTDRIVYSEAKAADPATVQMQWTRLDGQGGSTIGATFTRPAGGVLMATSGTIFYSLHDKSILEWDSAANTVKTSENAKAVAAGAVVAGGKLYLGIGAAAGTDNGVFEADTSKTPPGLASVMPDPFGANATASGDVLYYVAGGKVLGYDAAGKKATTPFEAKDAVAAAGDAKGVFWLSRGASADQPASLYAHGADGKDTKLGEAACNASGPRLLLTSRRVLLDCPQHAAAFERP